MSKIRFVGLDVHADTIAVAVAALLQTRAGDLVRWLGEPKAAGTVPWSTL